MTDQSYVCSSCGKTHKGLPTDWGFRLPDQVFELSYLDKYRRTRSNADLCSLDESSFLENYSNELAQGTRASGVLANAIPGFREITGEALDIEFQNAKSRPHFHFSRSAEHELAADQRNGIGHDRHHQFLELCGHFDESDT